MHRSRRQNLGETYFSSLLPAYLCHPLCPGPACPTLQYGLPGEEESTQYETGEPGDNQEIRICLAGPQTDAWVKSLEPGHPPRLGD